MAKWIPWQDLTKILATILPRSCQDLTKISTEGQPGIHEAWMFIRQTNSWGTINGKNLTSDCRF